MASIVSLFHTSILVCFVLFLVFFSGLGFICPKLLSHVWLFDTPWTAACRASMSFNISWNLLKLLSIESVMLFSLLILCHPLLLPPSVFPRNSLCQWVSFLHQVAKTIAVSASSSVHPKYFQGCFLLRVTGVISLLPKWLSRVFSSSTVKKH